MYGLNTGDHLLSKHAYRFHAISSSTHIKKIFQGWTKQINAENVMQSFLTKIINVGDTNRTGENFVRTVFVAQLRSVGFPWFKFNRDLLVVKEVCSFVDDAKAAFADLPPDTIMHPNDIGRSMQ